MVNRRRARILSLGALALVVALLPAGLAAGSHDGSTTTFGDPSVILLTLGTKDEVRWPNGAQNITIRNNNCTVTVPTGILNITPTGGQLGAVKDGLGVKSSMDGTGEPCGRVEASDGEAISVALGSDLDGYLMSAIDVDLELKFNAIVDVIFMHDGATVHTFEDFSGTGGSDDGPDSGDGDNFRFSYPGEDDDPILFDTVMFNPTAGAMSLEGGADGTENGSLAPNNSSQFQVVQSFDGEITCSQSETIAEDGVSTSGVVTMHSEDPDGEGSADWTTESCDLKPFSEDVEDDALAFVPVLAGTAARYTIEVTVEDQAVTVGSGGQITSLIAVFNANGDLSFPDTTTDPLQPCVGQPVLDQSAAGYDAFWTQPATGLLPGTEAACWYHASVDPTGAGSGTEHWGIYFEDDPGFSFR
jgi:hypothetical protein